MCLANATIGDSEDLQREHTLISKLLVLLPASVRDHNHDSQICPRVVSETTELLYLRDGERARSVLIRGQINRYSTQEQ